MGIKTIATKLLTGIVCLATALSISVTGFAVDDNANNTGENGAGIANKPGYDNTEYGYRISIVDGKTGESKGTVDLTTDGFYDGSDRDYTGVGTDSSTTGNTGRVISGETVNGMPPAPLTWTGNSFTGNGDAVNTWMMETNPETGNQNIVDLALKNFAGTPAEKEALVADIKSGKIKICNEPMFNIPLYQGRDNYLGERITGSIRDIVQVLQDRNLGLGGWMSPVTRAGLEAFFLERDDLGLSTMSDEELLAVIDKIILNGDLSTLGVGMHLYDMSDNPPPPDDEPETPPAGTEGIHITESRITRRKDLSDSELDNGDTLSGHEFKWEIEAFSTAIQTCVGCHHNYKDITDKDNTINVEEHERPKAAQGVIDAADGSAYDWSYVYGGGDKRFVQHWAERTVNNDKYKFSGVCYNIVVIRKDDKIGLIDYNTRYAGNQAIICGAPTNGIVSTNNIGNRYANGSYEFYVDLHYEPNESKWGYEKKTVYTHKDYHDTTPSPTESNPNPSHSHSSSTRTETKETEFNAGTAVDMKVHVTWDVYGGVPNGGTKDTTSAGLTQHLNGNKQETWLEIPMENGETSFYPYIKMQYDTDKVEHKEVYAAGQYQRAIAPNEYVGVLFDLSGNKGKNGVVNNTSSSSLKGKLTLSSNQWSTHAKARDMIGKTDCVIPGGATLDLAILDAERQTFTVEGLAPILSGSGKKQVNATGSSGLPTQYEGLIQDNYIKYAKQVVESLETLNVQQYVSGTVTDKSKLQNITQAVWDMTNAKAVSPKSDTDEKYYS